jgi:hypothetical protein
MIIPSEIYITSFDNMKSSKSNLISLYQEFGNIKRGKYKDIIIKCRQAVNQKNKELYTSLKNQLPAVTFCGEFTSGRKASNITKYNNLMILDIDYLDISTMNFNISHLQKDKYIMALWLSPSGLGLKGIVKINSDINKHKYVFNALRIYFLEKYKIELDKSGSDVSRLCFSSWDENFYYNENSEIFNDYLEIEEIVEEKVTPIIKKSLKLRKNANATEGFNKREDTKTVREIIKFLEKKDVSITESYDDWIKVALGISYTFSYDVGEKYFLKICSLDKEKHSEEQSIILLRYCYNKREYGSSSSISIGTIIYFAKLKGFIVKRNGAL